MNVKKTVFCLLIIASKLKCAQANFWYPGVNIPQPRFTRTNLTTFDLQTVYGFAHNSFNHHGAKTTTLGYHGPEPLLPQFVDNTISITNATPVGYALFDAKFTTFGLRGQIVQNIYNNFYIRLASSLHHDKLKDITIIPTNQYSMPLKQDKIDQNAELTQYLAQLKTKIFDSCLPEQHKTTVRSTALLLGYSKHFDHFQYFDFVDFTLQSGFICPTFTLEKPTAALSIFPHNTILNIGVPLQLCCNAGLYDWLNIGFAGTLIGYIQNDNVVPLNTAAAANKLLTPSSGLCTVHHHPKIAFDAYVEGEYFIPQWTWLVGLSYAKQYKTTYKSHDPVKFPAHIINTYPMHHPWEIAYVTLSSEIDLSKEDHQVLPRIKFIYVQPFYGSSCMNTTMIAGQCGFEIIYDF